MLKRLGIAFAFVAIAVGYAFADDVRKEAVEHATDNAIDACFIRWSGAPTFGTEDLFAACVKLALRERAIALSLLANTDGR